MAKTAGKVLRGDRVQEGGPGNPSRHSPLEFSLSLGDAGILLVLNETRCLSLGARPTELGVWESN